MDAAARQRFTVMAANSEKSEEKKISTFSAVVCAFVLVFLPITNVKMYTHPSFALTVELVAFIISSNQSVL